MYTIEQGKLSFGLINRRRC